MAQIIPSLNKTTLSKMTSGEKRFARRLEKFLEDDYIVWYDIPVGKYRRYPDFIILHPDRGLLFLEIKDWKASTLKNLSKTSATLLTDKGKVETPHPLEQARQYTMAVINSLQKDKHLCESSGKYEGKLSMPYGWGAVVTNISRSSIHQAIDESNRDVLVPDHLMMYKDDMLETSDPEVFQEKLWGMFHYQFNKKLTLPQIDRIRWHLFPEVRIDANEQVDLFAQDAFSASQSDNKEKTNSEPLEPSIDIPDIVKIMDIQQEQLARSLGEGHRVIHGVAGSGKTMILGYRCLHLASTSSKPILVLCFNAALAAALRSFIQANNIQNQVQIYHFHDWCGQQLKTYNVDIIQSDSAYYIREVETVIKAVDDGFIPRAQYGAVLIDEGHDFEADWLELVVSMVDPENDSLLMLYDDAQSIYKKKKNLDFSLASVGIKAQGRTTILRLNYRNSQEILNFAYDFAKGYWNVNAKVNLKNDEKTKLENDESNPLIPLIEPQSAGRNGEKPVVRSFNNFKEEINYTIMCIKTWQERGIALNDIAILYAQGKQGEQVNDMLKHTDIPYLWLSNKKNKMAFDPKNEKINLLTMHSSKGLEFKRVIIVGLGHMDVRENKKTGNARLLYVGMTRAQDCLLITHSKENVFTQQLVG